MKTKVTTFLRVSRDMHAIEDEIDSLLGRIGRLTGELTEARIEFDVDANEGQRILTRIIGTQTALIEARLKATGAHSDLKKFSEVRADFPQGCPDSTMGFDDGNIASVKAA